MRPLKHSNTIPHSLSLYLLRKTKQYVNSLAEMVGLEPKHNTKSVQSDHLFSKENVSQKGSKTTTKTLQKTLSFLKKTRDFSRFAYYMLPSVNLHEKSKKVVKFLVRKRVQNMKNEEPQMWV